MTRKPSNNSRKNEWNTRKHSWFMHLLSKFCTHPWAKTRWGRTLVSVDFEWGFVFTTAFVVECSWCGYLLDAGVKTEGGKMECTACDGKGYRVDENGNAVDCHRCKNFDE